MRRQDYRTEWRAIWTPDPYTGKLRISVYYPHRVPVRTTCWRDRFRDFGGFDVVMLGGVVALVILAAVTR